MSDEVVATVIRYWMDKARESLDSARAELDAGRHAFAVNRAYYAAFYAASAVLLARGERFVKHSGVRGAVHRHLVKPGLLGRELGLAYDRLFQDRQEADYVELSEFSEQEVREAIGQAVALVRRCDEILRMGVSDGAGD